jgi:hypothetical protein
MNVPVGKVPSKTEGSLNGNQLLPEHPSFREISCTAAMEKLPAYRVIRHMQTKQSGLFSLVM